MIPGWVGLAHDSIQPISINSNSDRQAAYPPATNSLSGCHANYIHGYGLISVQNTNLKTLDWICDFRRSRQGYCLVPTVCSHWHSNDQHVECQIAVRLESRCSAPSFTPFGNIYPFSLWPKQFGTRYDSPIFLYNPRSIKVQSMPHSHWIIIIFNDLLAIRRKSDRPGALDVSLQLPQLLARLCIPHPHWGVVGTRHNSVTIRKQCDGPDSHTCSHQRYRDSNGRWNRRNEQKLISLVSPYFRILISHRQCRNV